MSKWSIAFLALGAVCVLLCLVRRMVEKKAEREWKHEMEYKKAVNEEIRRKAEGEKRRPKGSRESDFSEVAIHKPMVFDIAYKKGATIGTMRMGDEEFEVYIGHGEIRCVEGTQKRKFTIIEV